MNGSRSHSSRTGASGSSLDALNRTIEGLEARIEDMLGRGGNAAAGHHAPRLPHASAPKPQAAGMGENLLEGIRARQRSLEQTRRGGSAQSTAPAPVAASAPGFDDYGRQP